MKIRLSDAATLFHGDCRDALRNMPSDSLDSCVTDPPYELNFMGKGWDDTGIANDPALWAEVFRVLKPGGHLVAFSASRTYHRMTCAIEDAGFEIRDSLFWCYATGFPKSLNVGKAIDAHFGAERTEVIGNNPTYRKDQTDAPSFTLQRNPLLYAPATDAAREWEGWGTALKPAFEPIVLARKPLSESTVAANVLRWRTGALNIDGCRVDIVGDRRSPAGADGKIHRTTGDVYGVHKQSDGFDCSQGRWPANVVTDGSDEVVGMFPNTTSGARNGVRKADDDRNAFGTFNGGDSGRTFASDSGSAARFFYSAKASKADRAGSKHPTVKPIALMEWLATLVTPPGGTILDPFAGSGTTGAAATNKGFRCVLVEREAEYITDIRRRFFRAAIEHERTLVPLIAELKARCA